MNTVISTNLSETVLIEYQGQQFPTGIYKYPVDEPLHLQAEQVEKDTVADRRVHGGIHKAVYAYSAEDYPFWQNRYPHLEWNFGMFGENLTMDELKETEIYIGDQYSLGNTILRVTQPREPCFKLGVRFGQQIILQEFVEHGRSGTYFAVEQEGTVKRGDQLIKVHEAPVRVSIAEMFRALYTRENDEEFLSRLQNHGGIPERLLRRFQ